MPLTRLHIDNFRNITSTALEPLPNGFNFFYGNNGSGKTSLLEAIYYLSRGQSFRSTITGRVINHSADKFSIFAHILATAHSDEAPQPFIPVGIERYQEGNLKIRILGQDVRSAAELASVTPIQLINSQCFCLLEAPGFRRKYLDWGIFYQSNDFLRLWQRFNKALKQRNAALRGQLPRLELALWTKELIESALLLDQVRKEYVERLSLLLLNTINELVMIDDLKIEYQQGWSSTLNYAASLADSTERDFALGYTQSGPHRADLKITVKGLPAKDILSRGQQKLLVCAMLLTQGALLQSSANRRPIYLVDDLPAELDMTSRDHLMTVLSKQETQVFVTAVERETLNTFLTKIPSKVFHVEHGDITEVA